MVDLCVHLPRLSIASVREVEGSRAIPIPVDVRRSSPGIVHELGYPLPPILRRAFFRLVSVNGVLDALNLDIFSWDFILSQIFLYLHISVLLANFGCGF